MWDVNSGEELLMLRGHTGTVVSAVFNPDGSQITSAGRDGLINIWDAQTGELPLTLQDGGSGVQSLAFTPDGKFLITTSNALRIYVVDVPDLVSLARARLTMELTSTECRKYLHITRCP